MILLFIYCLHMKDSLKVEKIRNMHYINMQGLEYYQQRVIYLLFCSV